MSSQTLALPPPIYQQLLEAARESGQTPVDWIAAHLPASANGSHSPTAAEIADANARLRAHRLPLSQSTVTDNAAIDADLIRAYANEPTE